MKTSVKLTSIILLLLLFSLKVYGQQTSDYQKFSIRDLQSQQKQKNKNSTTFLSENTLIGKLLHINKNEKVKDVLEYDMVLYVINGNGKLKAGNTDIPLSKGS